jgi:hypothetical protein
MLATLLLNNSIRLAIYIYQQSIVKPSLKAYDPNTAFKFSQVFVSLSYRLNAFGFLSWEDEVLPGNLGLLDQYLAILWVYENIGKSHTFTVALVSFFLAIFYF